MKPKNIGIDIDAEFRRELMELSANEHIAFATIFDLATLMKTNDKDYFEDLDIQVHKDLYSYNVTEP